MKENKKICVSIQGVKGSFHEEAAHLYFGDNIDVIECRAFKNVVQEVDLDRADYAVLAIENSIAGSLLPNYALIRDYHLRVVGELFLHIQMNLMMIPGSDMSSITEVHSHPIALQQCREYIDSTMPDVILKEKSDTAGAALELNESKRKDVATIGNQRTSELYNLEIKEKGIETNKKNYTRFLILGKKGNAIDGTNKASICFECGHYCGALANVLAIFSEYNINLTKIQSLPILGKPKEYYFHADIEYYNIDNYEKAIHHVLKNVSSLSILGEYNKAKNRHF